MGNSGTPLAAYTRPQIVGIVNITTDSFSDGGKFLDAEKAIAHAEQLLADGADILDLGAAASNPHAARVEPEEEIRRLEPVVSHLQKKGALISIDTTKIEVQRWALEGGVEFLNDIRGFPGAALYPDLAQSNAKLVVMHFISDLDKAVRQPKSPEEVFDSINTFFEKRLPLLKDAGISDGRIVIDPGMGFFLASNPEPSLAVLARFPEFKERFKLPIMIGVSRKSFLKNLGVRESADIQVRTLAAELAAAERGADYIRTHDVKALAEGLRTWEQIVKQG
ncbi:dihydropteroate synthase [Candidatus Parcubacteria bacterium]|nr:MAG: dihydropteroate synthase [Candidatus Parcubacteria bacterium]